MCNDDNQWMLDCECLEEELCSSGTRRAVTTGTSEIQPGRAKRTLAKLSQGPAALGSAACSCAQFFFGTRDACKVMEELTGGLHGASRGGYEVDFYYGVVGTQ